MDFEISSGALTNSIPMEIIANSLTSQTVCDIDIERIETSARMDGRNQLPRVYFWISQTILVVEPLKAI